MEHAGKILYNASGLLLDESATQNQYLGRASVIAHETAHMWFGDLVTMRWFNDVWMKEVFANFMAAKIVNPSFPEVNHELRFLLVALPCRLRSRSHAWRQRHPAAAGEPERSGQPLRRDHLSEGADRDAPPRAPDGRGSVSRRPARISEGACLRQRHVVGPHRRARSSARRPTSSSGAACGSRSRAVRRFRPSSRSSDGKIAELTFRQRPEHRALQSQPSNWPQQLRVALGYPDGASGSSPPIFAASRSMSPRPWGCRRRCSCLPTGGGWAYGGFPLDKASLDYLTQQPARDSRSADARRGVGHAVGCAARADVQPTAFVELAMNALPRETDEQLTSRVLGYLGAAWWRFLSTGERQARVVAGRTSCCETGCRTPRRRVRSRPGSARCATCSPRRKRRPGCAASGRRRKRSTGCRWPKRTTRRWR